MTGEATLVTRSSRAQKPQRRTLPAQGFHPRLLNVSQYPRLIAHAFPVRAHFCSSIFAGGSRSRYMNVRSRVGVRQREGGARYSAVATEWQHFAENEGLPADQR
jgi:hypothetical protein